MEVPVLSGPACHRCGDDVDSPGLDTSGELLCRACRLAPPAFERAVAYAFYQDRMRGVIHALKYDHMHPAAGRMGRMLAQAIASLAPEAPAEMLVVPIPLHRSRQAERGFNQARLLAAHALKALRSSHPEWRLTLAPAALMRLRATESQVSLTPRERRNNVRSAFSVSDAALVRGRNILLVDDILTTGATARSAAQALRRAGAATVWVATLARARRIHRGTGVAVTNDTGFAESDTQSDTKSAGAEEQQQQQARVDSSMNRNQPSF
jgi:ComF family protein